MIHQDLILNTQNWSLESLMKFSWEPWSPVKFRSEPWSLQPLALGSWSMMLLGKKNSTCYIVTVEHEIQLFIYLFI